MALSYLFLDLTILISFCPFGVSLTLIVYKDIMSNGSSKCVVVFS